MKIRNGYISNSSASAFIIKNFNDIELIKSLIKLYIGQINFDAEFEHSYNVTKNGIKEVFEEIFKSNRNEELLEVYIKNELWFLFDELFEFYVNKRNLELAGCESCEFWNNDFPIKYSNECKKCSNLFTARKVMYSISTIAENMSTFSGDFDFTKDQEEIKDFVYSCKTKNINDEILVHYEYSEHDKLIEEKIEKYYKLWKQKYPNAFVFSFASDEGNNNSAYLRSTIDKFGYFMKQHNVDGIYGENS